MKLINPNDPLFISEIALLKSIPIRLNSLVLPCSLKSNFNNVQTCAFVDSGGNGYGFIDSSFVQKFSLPVLPLSYSRVLRLVDGRTSAGGVVTHSTNCYIQIGDHCESAHLFITKLGQFPIILGHEWLSRHNPEINWKSNSILFSSTFCQQNRFLLPPRNPIPCQIATSPENNACPNDLDQYYNPTPTKYPIPSANLNPSEKQLRNGSRVLGLNSETIKSCISSKQRICSKTLDVRISNSERIDDPPSKIDFQNPIPLEHDPDQAIVAIPHNRENKLPPWLHHQKAVFSKAESLLLPPNREIDHKIILKEGTQPPFGRLYGMTKEELSTLREWLQENLSKGFIRPSSSPAASPVLFVKKSDGKLRLCMDYRALNAITVKNRYPIPLISETLDRLSKAKFFTKVDVIAAFNRIRIAKGDEWKTAFRTRYGLFESLVRPFGLTNAPSTFQNYINSSLQQYLDVFCTAYLDDVLIYSNTQREHRQHVNIVLDKLRDAGLQLDLNKCQFEASEVKYLGLIISCKGIEMDPKKIDCIRNWKTPRNVKDIQAFLGFANFYRRFIRSFSTQARPLIEMTKKNVPWVWSGCCQKSFDKLKGEFIKAPILRHFDPDKRCIVEVDSSDWACGGILSQYDDKEVLHPVAYFSNKLSPTEINYEIYDKELLAVVRALEHWRPELEGTIDPISIITDHKNLEYFMTTKVLNRRQARWSEFLSRFNFVISYRPGKQGGKPDSLTRRSEDLPSNTGDERIQQQQQVVLKNHNLDPKVLSSFLNTFSTTESILEPSPTEPNPNRQNSTSDEIEKLLSHAYERDFTVKDYIKKLLGQGPCRSKHLDLSRCSVRNNRLYYDDLIFVPDNDELKHLLIKSCHDHPSGGHHGRNKIFAHISRDYWWPNMIDTVTRYTNNCHICKRITPSRLKYQGLLKQLPVPERRWRDISVDFIGPLPKSRGFDCVMVVGCRLTKARHLIPCKTAIDAAGTANLFYHHVWKHHGFPESIVSDRGPQFVAKFWNAVCERTNTRILLSTAWHPESDGQTERFNAVLECYLRAYCNYQQDDWVDWLPSAEYNANDAESETTKVTPFFANTAQHPRSEITPRQNQNHPNSSKYFNALQKSADKFVNQMEDLNNFLRDNMKTAQAFYVKR